MWTLVLHLQRSCKSLLHRHKCAATHRSVLTTTQIGSSQYLRSGNMIQSFSESEPELVGNRMLPQLGRIQERVAHKENSAHFHEMCPSVVFVTYPTVNLHFCRLILGCVWFWSSLHWCTPQIIRFHGCSSGPGKVWTPLIHHEKRLL